MSLNRYKHNGIKFRYVYSPPDLFSVGFYDYDGNWQTVDDCFVLTDAIEQVNALNGKGDPDILDKVARKELEREFKDMVSDYGLI